MHCLLVTWLNTSKVQLISRYQLIMMYSVIAAGFYRVVLGLGVLAFCYFIVDGYSQCCPCAYHLHM
jgi:hypothetical protein